MCVGRFLLFTRTFNGGADVINHLLGLITKLHTDKGEQAIHNRDLSNQ